MINVGWARTGSGGERGPDDLLHVDRAQRIGPGEAHDVAGTGDELVGAATVVQHGLELGVSVLAVCLADERTPAPQPGEIAVPDDGATRVEYRVLQVVRRKVAV